MSMLRVWYEQTVQRILDSAIQTGMDPAPSAGRPAFAGPVARCAVAGALAGGFLSSAAALAVGSSRGLLVLGLLGVVVGAGLGGTLRAFSESLWGLPRFVPVAFGAVAGAGLGALAPLPEALPVGTALGALLAALFVAFERRLP